MRLVMTSCLLLAGCASMFSTDRYPVNLSSNMKDAEVVIRNEDGEKIFMGTTPTTVSLDAGEPYFDAQSYTITFSKDGKTFAKEITASLDPWYIATILWWPISGALIVDPLTGAMWKLPSNVMGSYTGDGQTSPQTAKAWEWQKPTMGPDQEWRHAEKTETY